MKILTTGGSARILFLFLMELFELDIITKQEMLIVHLHSKIILEENTDIINFLQDARNLSLKPQLKIDCIDNLEDGLIECNLFIIFGDFTRYIYL